MKKYILLVIFVIILSGCSFKKVEEQSDSKKFAIEFDTSEKNNIIYSNPEEILYILQGGTGIVFIATSDNFDAHKIAQALVYATNKEKIERVYYFNLKAIKNKDNKKYNKIVSLLNRNTNNEFEPPAILFIRNGNLINYSLDKKLIARYNKDGYTKKKEQTLRNKYIGLIKEYKEKM